MSEALVDESPQTDEHDDPGVVCRASARVKVRSTRLRESCVRVREKAVEAAMLDDVAAAEGQGGRGQVGRSARQ